MGKRDDLLVDEMRRLAARHGKAETMTKIEFEAWADGMRAGYEIATKFATTRVRSVGHGMMESDIHEADFTKAAEEFSKQMDRKRIAYLEAELARRDAKPGIPER